MPATEWRVLADRMGSQRAVSGESVPIKWAHDAVSGSPRYIHDQEVVDKIATAFCAACSSTLWPVLAGQQ